MDPIQFITSPMKNSAATLEKPRTGWRRSQIIGYGKN